MNVLNQTIDCESINVLNYICEVLQSWPLEETNKVVQHKFGKKDMQSVH